MCKNQTKLFDFNRDGALLDASEIIDSKTAKEFIKKLQSHKAMGDNWKLDIFIDDSVESLSISKIPESYAFQKGKFEFGIYLNKIRHKGHPSLEHGGNCLFASFPSEKKAHEAITQIISFIKYRYNIDLKLDMTFICRDWNKI